MKLTHCFYDPWIYASLSANFRGQALALAVHCFFFPSAKHSAWQS